MLGFYSTFCQSHSHCVAKGLPQVPLSTFSFATPNQYSWYVSYLFSLQYFFYPMERYTTPFSDKNVTHFYIVSCVAYES